MGCANMYIFSLQFSKSHLRNKHGFNIKYKNLKNKCTCYFKKKIGDLYMSLKYDT